MIRMSETTRTHTPGKQLNCDILISSLMKHVLTNRPMFHSDSEELRTKIWATKSTYSDQIRNIEKESSIRSMVGCSFVLGSISVFMSLDPFQNSINLFKRRMLDSNLSWGGVFKICRHLVMVQITDRLSDKKFNWNKFGRLRFFGNQEKLWQSQFLQKSPCFVSSFSLCKRLFLF